MQLLMKHWFEQTYDKLIFSQLIFGDFRFVASSMIDIRASSKSTYNDKSIAYMSNNC